MKNLYSLFLIGFLVLSCNSVKRTQKYTARGDYDKAIELGVKKLQKDKTSRSYDEHIRILEDAYLKAKEEDTRRIAFLKNDPSLNNVKELYYTYLNLEKRQNLIRPLLPLYSREMGRNANFNFNDYNAELRRSKTTYVAALYEEAKDYLQRNFKEDYRIAYDILSELEEVQPRYKNANELRQEAHFKGTDFILVSMNNHSGQIIPLRLEQDLLAFNTFGLNDMWKEYHSRRENGIQYDMGIDLNFQAIDLSPERVFDERFTRTAKIKDGYETKKNRRGVIQKDSLGNPIQVEKFIDVSAEITTTTQDKSVFVGGTVVYRDLKRRRDINQYPLSCEFIFENIFATYRGDERALSAEDRRIIRNGYLPFPSSAQMVLDAGEEIKLQLKQILDDHPLPY